MYWKSVHATQVKCINFTLLPVFPVCWPLFVGGVCLWVWACHALYLLSGQKWVKGPSERNSSPQFSPPQHKPDVCSWAVSPPPHLRPPICAPQSHCALPPTLCSPFSLKMLCLCAPLHYHLRPGFKDGPCTAAAVPLGSDRNVDPPGSR